VSTIGDQVQILFISISGKKLKKKTVYLISTDKILRKNSTKKTNHYLCTLKNIFSGTGPFISHITIQIKSALLCFPCKKRYTPAGFELGSSAPEADAMPLRLAAIR
jgi:hypothetical protein